MHLISLQASDKWKLGYATMAVTVGGVIGIILLLIIVVGIRHFYKKRTKFRSLHDTSNESVEVKSNPSYGMTTQNRNQYDHINRSGGHNQHQDDNIKMDSNPSVEIAQQYSTTMSDVCGPEPSLACENQYSHVETTQHDSRSTVIANDNPSYAVPGDIKLEDNPSYVKIQFTNSHY